jgi:hypothetical protein
MAYHGGRGYRHGPSGYRGAMRQAAGRVRAAEVRAIVNSNIKLTPPTEKAEPSQEK